MTPSVAATFALLVANACSDPADPGASGLAIDPAHVVLEEGTRQSFAVTGSDSDGSDWVVSGGSFTERGDTIEWEAPFESGGYTIKASSAADPRNSTVAIAEVVTAEGASSVSFSAYRGTPETLPAGMFVTGEDASGNGPGEGWDPFTGVNDISADARPLLEGFGAFTDGDGTYSFGIRERGEADLRDARLFLPYVNTSERDIIAFMVEYDVEVWLIGERANRFRLKLNTATTGFSDLPDLVSTVNPRSHDSPGAAGQIVNGTHPKNRVRETVVIDLAELPSGESRMVGRLVPGDTVYLRWQYSNAEGDRGGLRSALGLRNIRVVPIYAGGTVPVAAGPLGFSHPAGFYTEPFHLALGSSMEGATIYYTVDGSEPDATRTMTDSEWEALPVEDRARTFMYDSPIDIARLKSRENEIAAIATTAITSGVRKWRPPSGEVNKAVVVRALAVSPASSVSSVSRTRTYFVEREGRSRYSLPVVSLSSDRSGLFADDRGIYVPGPNDENHLKRGKEWERPAYLELFDPTGNRVLSQTVGIRIHGGWTRGFAQKSLRLYSRSSYGTSRLSYRFFDSKPNTDFNRIILRNTGNDWGFGLMRDGALQSLVRHLPFETQHYTPVIVFINGEYWGVHEFRDRYDQHHLETHYNVPRDAVTILEPDATVNVGKPGDDAPYREFLGKVQAGALPSFDAVDRTMDLNGYIDYVITEMYAANTDWLSNNIKWWHYNGPPTDARGQRDGRWRWMMYDVDLSLGNHTATATTNMVELVLEGEPPWSRELIRGLVEIEEIRHELLQRTAVHLATTFRPERVRPHLESVAQRIEPEVEEHVSRWTWPESKSAWQQEVATMLDFAVNRPRMFRRHIIDYFDDVSGTAAVEITNLGAASAVTLHSVPLDPSTPGVRISGGAWAGELFTGIPVVIESPDVDLRAAEVSGAVARLARSHDQLRFILEGPVRIALP